MLSEISQVVRDKYPQVIQSQRFCSFISLHWNPGLCGLSLSSVGPAGLFAHKCGTTLSTSHHLATGFVHPICPSLVLLPVWMNVSSLTPWLLDFHTVQFSGIYAYFLFLNSLLSFFCYCARKQSVFTYTSVLTRSPSLSIILKYISPGELTYHGHPSL